MTDDEFHDAMVRTDAMPLLNDATPRAAIVEHLALACVDRRRLIAEVRRLQGEVWQWRLRAEVRAPEDR